jgi:hypothetical protein
MLKNGFYSGGITIKEKKSQYRTGLNSKYEGKGDL